MSRYTKQQREDAALICAVQASTPGHVHSTAVALGISPHGRAAWLATAAWIAAWMYCTDECGAALENDHANPNYWRALDAEAEALIRCGWSPDGDA